VSPADHEQLDQRYWQLERQLQDLHAGKVVRGDPTTIEGQLLEAQDGSNTCWARIISTAGHYHEPGRRMLDRAVRHWQ
jgi:hypothetical protein